MSTADAFRQILTVDTGEGVIAIPYFRLEGSKPGKTLFISAGEHGIETAGMAAVYGIVRDFDPAQHAGTIIAVPVVTPPNLVYRHHTKGQQRGRGYTLDLPWNTYGRWPGKADGDPADRICHAIATLLLPKVDCVINFHGWSFHSASACFPGGNPAVADEIELGKRLGIPFVVGPSSTESTLSSIQSHVSRQLRIPGYLIELRQQWALIDAEVARGMRAVRNACRFLGLRSDPMEVEPKLFYLGPTSGEELVRAPHDGLYVPRVSIEQEVRKDQVIGDLWDPSTGIGTEIRSHVDAVTWLVQRIGAQADLVLEDTHSYAKQGDILALLKTL